MSDQTSQPGPDEVPLARRAVLPYRSVIHSKPVTIGRFFDRFEAQLYANELTANAIDSFLLNQNADVLGPYGGGSQVELQVREDDLAEARALLERFHVNPAEVEPAEDSDPNQPIPDPAGAGVLVSAAAYDNPRELFDAASILGSAHVECFLPRLVPRGDRPAEEGKRFVLWVREADRDRARAVLERSAADDAESDEPRCPHCGSYRVDFVSTPWPGLVQFLLGRRSSGAREMQCYRCKARWTVADPLDE